MKKKLLRVLAVILTVILLLTCVTSSVYGWWGSVEKTKSLEMYAYYGCGDGSNACGCCGPCSGVSIGGYYRDEREYSELEGDHAMYDELYDCFPTYDCWTSPLVYGHGFREMTELHYYDNFSYVNYGAAFGGEVVYDDFWDIVDAIDNGWPVVLDGNFCGVDEISGDPSFCPQCEEDWPYLWGHYVAIRGYSYRQNPWFPWITGTYRIICTDSYCGCVDHPADNLVLSWDDIIDRVEAGISFSMITIKDN